MIIFVGMQTLIGDEFVPDKAIVVKNDRIIAIIEADEVSSYVASHGPASIYTLNKDQRACPGLKDLHMHGTHGFDAMDGNEQNLRVMSQKLAAEGVTDYLATTMTASNEQTELALKAIRAAMSNEEGAAIVGVHLEGPCISPHKLGAQKAEGAQKPNDLLLQRWQTLSGDAIKLVTLAPELPGALELITSLRKLNIVASIGHTNASYDETNQAILQGATHATHLFNAMSPLNHRAPGATGALLQSRQIMTELIVDGIHLHPSIVKMVFELKGTEGIILITDSMRAKGLCDGISDLGGQDVQVKDNKAVLVNTDVIAGSITTLLAAIKKMVEYSGCTLAQAFVMATRNPSKAIGLTNDGSIKLGYKANLVMLDEDLQVMMTLREGRPIFTNGQLIATPSVHIPTISSRSNDMTGPAIRYEIENDANNVAKKVALIIHNLIKANNKLGKPTVLGLATGGTVEPLYAELIRLYKHENDINFYSKVITFNLDEYQGLSPDHPSSYSYYMHNIFFNFINIPKENIHLLDGTIIDPVELEDHLSYYEWLISEHGGIDIQILGIGTNGHIAFNEPGSSTYSRTRVVSLDKNTIDSNARFFSHAEDVPTHALTMGLSTIFKAKCCLLLATGDNKAEIIAKTVNGPKTTTIPATILKTHQNVIFFLDLLAARLLEKQKLHFSGFFNPNSQTNKLPARQRSPEPSEEIQIKPTSNVSLTFLSNKTKPVKATELETYCGFKPGFMLGKTFS